MSSKNLTVYAFVFRLNVFNFDLFFVCVSSCKIKSPRSWPSQQQFQTADYVKYLTTFTLNFEIQGTFIFEPLFLN